jgi:hypothetical protein
LGIGYPSDLIIKKNNQQLINNLFEYLNYLIVIRNQWVDHEGHVGHQEGAWGPKRCIQ